MKLLVVLGISLGLAGVCAAGLARTLGRGAERVSRLGEYRGYSRATHDGYLRRSDYLVLRDGTRLAWDLLLPTRGGEPETEPLPVLLVHTPYLRVVKVVEDGRVLGSELFGLSRFQRLFLWLRARLVRDGHRLDQVFRAPWLERLLHHGYAVVAVERAGTGASSGSVHPSWEVAAREVDQVLDWIAAQPWSNGRIGMFGDSYEAMTQYAAASTGNPKLRAIFPCSAGFDMYDGLFYPGGIHNRAFTSVMARATGVLETMTAPVDSDPDGAELARILEQRRERTLGEVSSAAILGAPLRDSRRVDGPELWREMGLYHLIERVNRSGVAVYNAGGWLDIFARDVLLWHANLEVPRRLLVRALHHDALSRSGPDLDLGAEAHRWFDFWLKEIDNGIMDEPPIHYRVNGAPARSAWRSAWAWPPPGQRPTRLFLDGGRTGSVASVNDGGLRRTPPAEPAEPDACDAYRVDYSTTSGAPSRWDVMRGEGRYPDLRHNDARALTYTTAPLDADLELTGHPLAHLWISSDAPDLDLFVYLEEVDARGRSHYVTEGSLRASHRRLSPAPYRNLGLPWRSSRAADLAPLVPGEPAELVLDLLPTSHRFAAGHRIRISVAGADADNFATPVREPAPVIQLLRGAGHASFVELPLAPPAAEEPAPSA